MRIVYAVRRRIRISECAFDCLSPSNVSQWFPIRFTFGSRSVHTCALRVVARRLPLHRATCGVASPDTRRCIGRRAAFSRPTRGVASGDASCCVARYEAMSWADSRPPWPFRSTDPVTSVDRLCYLGGPIAALRLTDFFDSVYRVCRPSGEPPFAWKQIKWRIVGCVMWRDGDWNGI